LTGAAAYRHDGDAAATGEDHLVTPSEFTVDALDQLVTSTPIALDLRAEAADGVAQLLGLGVARTGERGELGLHGFESFGGGIDPVSTPPASSSTRPTSRFASPSSLSLRMRVIRILRSFIFVSVAASRASRSRCRACSSPSSRPAAATAVSCPWTASASAATRLSPA